jgi:prefoldin subunit 5
MNDIDYQALLSAYQKKVSELSNQVVVYEAKINSLSSTISELNIELDKLKKSKTNVKKESDF